MFCLARDEISWALFYLAQHPEIVLKVRNEATSIYNHNSTPNNAKELNKLKYANAVAQEAIRLKPVSPNLYMQANEDIVLQNLLIPKNTPIMLQNKVAQTSLKYFSHPNKFIPERWIKTGCPMQKNHSPEIMRAFGGGSRYCPGMNLAMHEMTIAISTICKKFDFKLTIKPSEVKEQFAFTMYPENLKMKFKEIN